MTPLVQTALTVILIAIAGSIAFVAYAAGAAGPMVFVGQSDANEAARDAWLQLPIHAAAGLLVMVAAVPAARAIVGRLVLGLAFVLLWWGAALTMSTISAIPTTDLFDVGVAATLLMLYAVIMRLAWISVIRPSPA